MSANGGSGVFQYTLNGETNNTGVFNNLSAGDYDLLVSDDLGCTSMNSFLLEQPDLLEADITENIAVNCFEGENGFAQINASGGTGVYTYTLGTASNNSGDFSNLLAGDYEVEVLDENGCTSLVDFSISEPDQITAEIVEVQNIDCSDIDGVGFVQVQATGGNGSFEYTLNGTSNFDGLFENLPAGDYEIQITDGNACSGAQLFSITEGANLNVAIDLIEEINCYNDNNGVIQVQASGGNGNYQYELDGVINTTGLFENLSGGFQDIIVIDTDGCESTQQYLLNQPGELLIDILEPANVSCSGETDGSLNVSVDGGTGDYVYNLNAQTNTSGFFSNLIADNYLLVITDGNGCSTSSTVTIEEPFAIAGNVLENDPVSCYGAEDGMVQVTGAGGNGNFSYTLGLESNINGSFENLPGGIYTLLLTDDNGCTGNMDVTITQPDQLETQILDIQSIGCSGNLFGSIQVLALGGTGNIEYTLGNETNATGIFENLNEGDYIIEAFDENNCLTTIDFSIIQSGVLEAQIINNTSVSCFGESDGMIQVSVNGTGNFVYTLGTASNTTGTFVDLPAGNYNLEITDGAGCDTALDFEITQPNAIIGEAIELSPLTCFGENNAVIQVEAFNGTGPYTFTLNNETNTDGGFENLSAGAYEILVSDQNDCTTLVDVFIIEPDAIQSEVVQNIEPVCNGAENGLIQIEAEGGAFPYQYTLGATTNNSGLFENIPAGNHQIMIVDDNGCSSIESVNLSQPEILISGVLNITPVECNGGNDAVIFMGAFGGVPPYQFELDGEVNNGGVFFNLAAGSYTVNVADANACMSEAVAIVSEPEAMTLEATNLQDDTGSGNGSVSLVTQGGIGPFQYSLDGNDYVLSGIFENLSVGTYTAYVRDSNGCISEVTFSIEMGTFISNPDQGVSDIQIFPNPFSNDLYLKIELSEAQDIEIKMYTIHGQVLYNSKNNFAQGTSDLRLDIPNPLPAGTYIFSIQNEQGQLGYYKIVKQ